MLAELLELVVEGFGGFEVRGPWCLHWRVILSHWLDTRNTIRAYVDPAAGGLKPQLDETEVA
jgi:hypothetical protein